MAQLALTLFGPLQATLDGVPVAGFESQKGRALLAYLMLEADRPHGRDALAELLWPNQPDQVARNNLRQALSNLRQTLGDQRATPPYLQITRDTIQFNRASAHQIDVIAFTELLTTCAQHPHRDAAMCRSCAQRRQQAVDIYQGDFLAGFFLSDSAAFEEWALLTRERLHRHALTALTQLAEYHERRGEYGQAQYATRRQLEFDPWREESHRQLLRVLACSGQRSAALMQYATCRRILADELGVAPEEETTALYERIERGEALTDGHTTLASMNVSMHTPLTPFIGRETELAQLADRLERRDCRLLTLVGPGGIGKTRLALQAARELHMSFRDGVYFVGLAQVQSAEFVISAIASTLEVVFHGADDHKTQLLAHLRTKNRLLVLDNFEHLLTAAPLISELLTACPDVVVLATSRAPLHVQGEQQFPVPPLHFPLLTQLPEVSRLIQYAAVALFIMRAQAVQAAFTITHVNAATVAEICARLDGLPLAIELAAARVKLFSLSALLARLDDRLSFLTGGARDLPARQQTIRATIAWSYDLLEQDTQPLFWRLAVFWGGCTLEAAEAVCNASSDLPVDVLDGLSMLVNTSLLRQEADTDGEPRFTMLETIREYAVERLEASGEAETMRQRHAAYFLGLAEAAEPQLFRPAQRTWLYRLEAEHENLRAALEWNLSARGDAELGLRLAGAIWHFWNMHGYASEGRVWLVRALAVSKAAVSPPAAAVRAKALDGLGLLTRLLGDRTHASLLIQESLDLYREMEDWHGIANDLVELGRMARDAGDYPRAQTLEEQGLAIFKERGTASGISWALISLGDVALDQGDMARATGFFQDALDRFRQEGNQLMGGWTQIGLGRIAYAQGNLVRALALFEEPLALFRELDYRDGVAQVLLDLARVARVQGHAIQATERIWESLALFRETGNLRLSAACLEGLAEVAAMSGQPERTALLFGAAEAMRDASGITLPPVQCTNFDRIIASVRDQLGEEGFAIAWAAGQSLTLEQAINETLQRDGNVGDAMCA